VRKRSIDVIVARHLQIASDATGDASSLAIGFHQDNPHTEPHGAQKRLIHAPPVVGPKAVYDRQLFDMFIAPTLTLFEAHKAAVTLRQYSSNPLRLNLVFQPNVNGNNFGCGVNLICDVEAAHAKVERRARTNEAKAKNTTASIIDIIATVRNEVAVETKARIDARVAARRRPVSTLRRVSSWMANGAGLLSTLATAVNSPAFGRPASDIDDEENEEEMELGSDSESSGCADEEAQLQEAIQNSLKPANTRTLAVSTSKITPRTIFDAPAPTPLPPKASAPKLKPKPAAPAPQGSILNFFSQARRN
jgi:hypothetical protein